MKQAGTSTMHRIWPALLILVAAVLFVGSARVHPGHATRAETYTGASAADAVPQSQLLPPLMMGRHGAQAGMAHGRSCCLAQMAAETSCAPMGCTNVPAVLPMAFADGIRRTPPIPPPSPFTAGPIG